MSMARLEPVMTERVVLIAIAVVVGIIFLAGCGGPAGKRPPAPEPETAPLQIKNPPSLSPRRAPSPTANRPSLANSGPTAGRRRRERNIPLSISQSVFPYNARRDRTIRYRRSLR